MEIVDLENTVEYVQKQDARFMEKLFITLAMRRKMSTKNGNQLSKSPLNEIYDVIESCWELGGLMNDIG